MFTWRTRHDKKGLVSLLLAALITCAALPSEASAQEALTLREAVGKALENNHEIIAFKNSLAAQQEEIGIARGNLLPKLTLEERFLRTNNPTYVFMSKLNQERFTMQDLDINALNSPAPENDFQTSLNIFQPLLALQAHIGIDMSKTAYAAKKAEYFRKQEEVALQVAQAYLMAQMAADYINVAQKGVADAAEHMRIARVNYENGLGLYADTLRAATAVTEAEQKLVSAEKNLKVAQRSLGLLLGEEHSIQTAADNPDIPLHTPDYYNRKVKTRRDIQSMQLHFANAENNLKLSKATYFPSLGVGSSYQFNDATTPFASDGQSWQVFAQFKWELFDGAKRQHEKEKARYQIAATRERLVQLTEAAAFTVFEAYLGVEEAQKKSTLAQAALATAEEGQRLVRLRYENTLSPMVDLLDAQASLDQARTNELLRKKEEQLATLKLCFESGIILQELGVAEATAEKN